MGDYNIRTLEKKWDVLGETIELTVLDLPAVIPVFDGISRSAAVVEILVPVDVGVIVVRKTWAVIVKAQVATFLRDRDVLDPAIPTPVSLPAMWLKITSTK